MKYILFIFSVFLLFPSCKEKSALEKEVMAVHDEVMPKLGSLNKTRRNLKKVLKSVEDESNKKEIRACITALENADEGMMTWMAEYKVPSEEPAKTEYLNKEMKRIQKVKVDMLESMKTGEDLLKKFKK